MSDKTKAELAKAEYAARMEARRLREELERAQQSFWRRLGRALKAGARSFGEAF